MKHKLSIILLLIFVTHFAFGQKTNFSSKLDSLLQIETPRKFNGTIIVSQDGKIKYSKCYGLADIANKTPLKLNDQFIIGSISKEISAVLVLQEIDKEHLSLQDPIKKHLPDLPEDWADFITIHHLLNHTSGIVGLNEPLTFKPGTQFSYSPIIGYELLANIIEKTSGESYETLVKRLFAQCKMKNTTIPELYDKQDGVYRNLVNSYSEQPDRSFEQEIYELKDIAFATPSGAIISTAKDLMIWNECLHNGKLLKKASYREMTKISTIRNNHRWGDIGYGYGIQIDNQDGQLEYSHSGALLGFISTDIYYPGSKISMIILENMAPDFNNMDRAFFFHDQIRKMIKESLKN